jgi:hypothetical protein
MYLALKSVKTSTAKFCKEAKMLTDRQQQVWDAYLRNGNSVTATARELKVSHQCISKMINVIKLAHAKAGNFGADNHTDLVPDGYMIKGVSTLQDAKTGEQKLRWVKVNTDYATQLKALQEAFDVICESVPPVAKVPGPDFPLPKALLNTYVITDYHLGMLAWGEETGDDWDTDKAEQVLEQWFTLAIKAAPDSEEAVFAQMGDFMHWDGLEAVTPTSKHSLDADTRFQRLVRVAIRVIRKVIRMLLQKHQRVTVIMAEGNHDIASSVWLRELFAQLYREEPRISVIVRPDPYYCVEFGQTSLFFHHGHKKRLAGISDVFVAKFRQQFGRTRHSYAHMGHYHHNLVHENNLMIVEQHRTLAASDAHASRGGWMSGREAKVITYHREYGEVMRNVVSFDMVKDSMEGDKDE